MPPVIRFSLPGITELVSAILERNPSLLGDTPSLAMFYTKAGKGHLAPEDYHRDLAERLGLNLPENELFPYAALARFADTAEHDERLWLNVTPVGYSSARAGLIMTSIPSHELDRNLADALPRTLNREVFSHHGLQLEFSAAGRWYLDASEHPGIRTRPIHEVNLSSASKHLPEGEDRLFWGRVLSEVEMVLHGNAMEDNAGSGVDGLWLWGEGRLPSLSNRTVDNIIHIATHDPALLGLAALAGMPVSSPEPELISKVVSNELYLVPNTDEWANDPLRQLHDLDEYWFKPALEWIRKRPKAVLMVEDAGHASRVLDKSGLRRWWRRQVKIR